MTNKKKKVLENTQLEKNEASNKKPCVPVDRGTDVLNQEDQKIDSDKNTEEIQVDGDTLPSPIEMNLRQDLEKLEAELSETKTTALRYLADLENFKKRKQQEVNSFKEYAQEKFLLDLLPIIDSFELATQHSKNNDVDPKDIIEGFLLIKKQIQTFLDKSHISVIESLNCPFDPNVHQAISQEDSDLESNTVTKEIQKGYKLKNKVIRPSMVSVAS